MRKRKFPGVISLRKLLPICAIPNGGLTRIDEVTFLKFTKMPCAVSGRRYARDASSRTGPTYVSNIKLNSRGSVRSQAVNSPGCFDGLRPHALVSRWSARNRSLHVRQSTSGSEKPATCPEATQTAGLRMIAESSATTSSRSWIRERRHSDLTLSFRSTP